MQEIIEAYEMVKRSISNKKISIKIDLKDNYEAFLDF